LNKAGAVLSPLLGLGRISGAQGLRGGLKIRPDAASATTDPEVIKALGEVVIAGKPYRVLEASRLKNQVVVELEGVATREQAEALAGQEVRAERIRFPALPPGEYYWFQLLGLAVIKADDGTLLGHLAEVMPTPGHDVFVVRRDHREALLPAVEGVIEEIDLKAGWIKVVVPPGLLEVYGD